MSRTITAQSVVTDREALMATDKAMSLDARSAGGQKAVSFKLPNWRHRITANLDTGKLTFDEDDLKYNKTIAQQDLDLFNQTYAAERVVLEAQRQGHTVVSREMVGDQVELMIMV